MDITMKCFIKGDDSLKETIRIGNIACQETLNKGFTIKTFNKTKLHHATYRKIRKKFPDLNSSYITAIRDQASDMLKRLKLKKRPIKKDFSSIRLNHNTFKLFLDSKIINISTINGREKYEVKIPEYFVSKYKFEKIKAGTIGYKKGKFLLNVIVDVKIVPKITPKKILGIDRGVYYPAVTSNNNFFNSRRLRTIKGRYRYLRSILQSKGTRSAKRKLKKLSGRERRFITDTNHCISKEIVNTPFDTFALEKLKIERYKRNGRKFNKFLGNWSPAQLLGFITYKAELIGKNIITVPANYTSQACSICGYISKDNRVGKTFQCTKCSYCIHSDLNASRNIASLGKAQLSRLDVNQPNVSCDDTKVSLKDKLRLSIVTSSAF